ncbi:MAG: hypothetical protein JSS66_03615 [Armatimonadetes bacterium]|nr:hypothetical protein [Armatimonadota bacterium]
MKAPISLLVDDPCPLIHVFRNHWVDVHHKPPTTADGRPLLEHIPNSFLDRFCDVMERWRIKGKFSIVPAPAGLGDVVVGIEGFDPELTHEWIATSLRRLGPICDFCPEMITHNLALDLSTGGFFDVGEAEWSQTQTRATLTPYVTHALDLLKRAGVDANGVTSPWVFGIKSEPEYIASIVAAQKAVYGRDESWYFLHMLWSKPETRPWIATEGLVAIPATVADWWWETIDSPRTDDAFVSGVCDNMLTEDGKRGQIIDVLEAGGWPIVLTHWQSLFSNGLETGLAVLEELGRRLDQHLLDRVEWMKCSEVAALVRGNNRST